MSSKESAEELTQTKELKKLIISTAKAFYGPKYPDCDTFDVVLSTDIEKLSGVSTEELANVTARVIVWAPKPLVQWRCLAIVRYNFTRVEALMNMLQKVERDFDDVVHNIEEGHVFNGL